MEFVFAIIFVVCLLFLALIFGERLSVFGLRDGAWLTAPFDLAAWFWNLICEGFDRVWSFVVDQFWWVLATSSASIGMFLIALLIVSGLSVEAKAIRADLTGELNVENVLDDVDRLDPTDVFVVDESLLADNDDVATRLLYQTPTRTNRFLLPPMPELPPEYDDAQNAIVTFPPPLESPIPDLTYTPRETRGQRLSITMQPFVERRGVPVFSEERRFLIDQAMQEVEQFDPGWRVSSSYDSTPERRRRAFPNDTQFDEERLLSSIRILPGEFISESNLDVIKNVPDRPTGSEFDIQITVRNLTADRVEGVVVRELLPQEWVVVDMLPRGVYRDSVATWVLDELRDGGQQTLTLSVRSTEQGAFESSTEVSAVAAVTTPTLVERQEERLPSVPRETEPIRDRLRFDFEEPEPELPPLPRVRERVRLPDVRLTFDKRPYVATADEFFEMQFIVSNVGDAPAENVVLRIELPEDLEHHAQQQDPSVRYVTARIRRALEPNERREMTFRARPKYRGRYEPVAELLFDGQQLDLQSFVIDAKDRVGQPDLLRPRPEF